MVNCCVINCPSNQFKRRGIAFHPLPSEDDLRQRWLKNISRPLWDPPETARVCSLHFRVDSYRKGFKYKVLHMDAMPTLFPPTLFPGAVPAKPTKPRKPKVAVPKKLPILTSQTLGNGSMPFGMTSGEPNFGAPNQSTARGRKKGPGKSNAVRRPLGAKPPRKRQQQSSVINGSQGHIIGNHGHDGMYPQAPNFSLDVAHHHATNNPFASSHPLAPSNTSSSSDHHHHAIGHLNDAGSSLGTLGHHPHPTNHLLASGHPLTTGSHHHSGDQLPSSNACVLGISPVQETMHHPAVSPGVLGGLSQGTPAPPSANYDAVEAHIQTIKEENEVSILKKKLKNKDALVRRRDKTIIQLASQLSSMERKCANAVAQVPAAKAVTTATNSGVNNTSTAFSALVAAHRAGDVGARFLMEQVEAFAAMDRHQWSDFALEHCAHWHLKSPEAYDFVKDSRLLRLPSRDTIILCTGVGELSMPETSSGEGGGVSGVGLFVDKLTSSVML